MNINRADYDSPWKEIIEQFFPDFIAFFFAHIAADIDWTRGYEFLDKELQKVVRDSQTGRKRVDKLVKVWRKNGEEAWIAIHIEVQGQHDQHFPQRMFQYHTLLYNHYKRTIVSLVILSDDLADWRPDNFGYELWGCKIQLDFPAVKLLDYQERWDEIEQDNNPFAIVVMTHLQAQATTPVSARRQDAKFRLARRLYEREYTRHQILELFRFIDWLMTLSPELETGFQTAITEYEEEQTMQYVTAIERKGIERGIERGIEQGIEQSTREDIIEVLRLRFQEIPAELRTQLDEINNTGQLKKLLKWAVIEPSLAAFAVHL
ncbi:MAG: hypothetical protein GWP17_02990 [Aquificales bacterium]|nr:hypothetical protein [Aquificales bacterium]